MKKYIAEFTKWNGEKEQIEIKETWIPDIVFAIEGQIYIANNKENFSINGSNYYHVDVYEIDTDKKEAQSNG